jgi:uncharacterized protein
MTAETLIRHLGLQPHPEGGYYKETYRSGMLTTNDDGKQRSVQTAIYYLLTDGDKSHFHRIKSDELWFFHQGDALEISYIEDGKIKHIVLGHASDRGETAQAMIPAHTWFGAKLKQDKGFALVSCTVAPGFDFADFEMAKRDELLTAYPDLRDEIMRFTR